jgi:hypothetical protein
MQSGGGNSTAGSALTASVTDSNGNTATVTYQVGKLLGTQESVVKISGDTSAAGTSVDLTIGGTSLGTVAIDSTGAGTLVVPTSSVASSVAAGTTVAVGTLNGSFAASTTTTSHEHTSLSASLTDDNGNTATVTYQTGKLLGTKESVVTVAGDTTDAGTSVSVAVGGTTIGSVTLDSTGSGTLIVPTASVATTVAAGDAVTVGSFSGTFADSTTSTSSGYGSARGFGRHGRR